MEPLNKDHIGDKGLVLVERSVSSQRLFLILNENIILNVYTKSYRVYLVDSLLAARLSYLAIKLAVCLKKN